VKKKKSNIIYMKKEDKYIVKEILSIEFHQINQKNWIKFFSHNTQI